jgi:hypothetical protein
LKRKQYSRPYECLRLKQYLRPYECLRLKHHLRPYECLKLKRLNHLLQLPPHKLCGPSGPHLADVGPHLGHLGPHFAYLGLHLTHTHIQTHTRHTGPKQRAQARERGRKSPHAPNRAQLGPSNGPSPQGAGPNKTGPSGVPVASAPTSTARRPTRAHAPPEKADQWGQPWRVFKLASSPNGPTGALFLQFWAQVCQIGAQMGQRGPYFYHVGPRLAKSAPGPRLAK